MKWISRYQFYLFDFDGLLVNTEPIHFQAYINVCKNRGVALDWSFLKYCRAAHEKSQGLKDVLAIEFPQLFENEARFEDIYQEKKEEYLTLVKTAQIELMPGVEKLIKALHEQKIPCCVVTNSTNQQTDLIIANQPLLELIPHWVTRGMYQEPKPSSESYLMAIKKYAGKEKKMIGFEDTVKGVKALMGTPAKAVLICPEHHLQMEALYGMGKISHFPSFENISDTI